MKKLVYLLIFAVSVAGCHTSKNTQRSVTTGPVINQSPVSDKKPIDSVSLIKERLSTLLYTPTDFITFYGKAKAEFSSPRVSGNATVYIHMLKDSMIWLSITGPLNIEGARVLITSDSVKIVNKLEGSAQLSSISHLQEITRLPFNFSDFQDIILGKPFVHDRAVLNYEFKTDSVNITAADALMKYIFSFTKNDFNLTQSHLQTQSGANIDANISYNNYRLVNSIKFSADRDIVVRGASPMDLQLNFREFNFNQPQTFLFTIPENYIIRYE